MPIIDVKITRHGEGAQFTLAAAQARAVADQGDVAKIYMSHDPKATQAAYVWIHPHEGYVVEAATFIEAPWIGRLRRTIRAGTQGEQP